MTDQATERLLSGRAWDDFCETVRQAGHRSMLSAPRPIPSTAPNGIDS